MNIVVLQGVVLVITFILAIFMLLRRPVEPLLTAECFMCKKHRLLGTCKWFAMTPHCLRCCKFSDSDGRANWTACTNPAYTRR